MKISCVLPCLNEEKNVAEIYRRIRSVLEREKYQYEVIFVDDGSTDGTWDALKAVREKDQHLKAIRLNRNYGQHAAVMAGCEIAQGDYVVTLDADLQNPPEEIPKLIDKAKEGYDIVGGWRFPRKDPLIRKFFSMMMNFVVFKSIRVRMHDYGCMLRLYRKDVVEAMLKSSESIIFIPALSVLFGHNIAEVKIKHEPRKSSPSRYNLFRLVRLNYDFMTGFSLLPIQMMTFAGGAISVIGFLLSMYLIIRSFAIKSDTGLGGIYTMFSVLYFFIGILILCIGIIGEYIGRMYIEIKKRPRYIVKEYLGRDK